MAAISYPSHQPLRHGSLRRRPDRHLRLVQGGLALPAGPPVAPGVYVRRRIAALVLFVVVSMLAVVAVQAVAARLLVPPAPTATGSTAVEVPVGAEVHVVQPGETLWAIAAERTPPGGDVRATVDRIVERNGGTGALQAGQRLVID